MDKRKLISLTPAVLFTLLVVTVIAIMGALPYDRPSTSATNSFGNLANGGYVSKAGSMLYYVDSKGVLRCKSDQNSYYIDENARCLSPYQSGIVYINENNEVIYSGFTGEGKRALASNARDMMVVGNWVFYSDSNGGLHKYFLKTDKSYSINLKCSQFMVSGTAVVYSDADGYMFTARTDGSNTEPFMAEKTDRFMRHDSYMFYLQDGRLYSVTSSNTAQKHYYCDADMFNLSEDGILFYTNDGSLYSMNITDQSPTSVQIKCENGVSDRGLFCIDDRVYFYDLSGTLISCKKDGSELLTY